MVTNYGSSWRKDDVNLCLEFSKTQHACAHMCNPFPHHTTMHNHSWHTRARARTRTHTCTHTHAHTLTYTRLIGFREQLSPPCRCHASLKTVQHNHCILPTCQSIGQSLSPPISQLMCLYLYCLREPLLSNPIDQVCLF